MHVRLISYSCNAQQKRTLRDVGKLEDTVTIGDSALHEGAVDGVEDGEVDERQRLARLLVEKQA